jgi:hypothetical protein
VKRSTLIRRTLENGICCRKFYEEKKMATTWQIFLQKVAYPFFTRFVANFFNKCLLAYFLVIILYIYIYIHS